MDARKLPARPRPDRYRKLAKDLLAAYRSGDAAGMRRVRVHYRIERPLNRDEMRAEILRRLARVTKAADRGARLTLSDARLLIARSYAFESWAKFQEHIAAVARQSSVVAKFEAAADAVISGDVAALPRLLRRNPELIGARSTRLHRSTLLHYVSANGVEDYRQKTPPNAVEIARLLLAAGAEVDAENYGYPSISSALGLVAASIHPKRAGVQIPLLETLLEAGARIDGLPGGANPLNAALANGRPEAAEFLAGRGARLDAEGAAGVGRVDVLRSLIDDASTAQTAAGFMWACEYGRTSAVEFLLRHGLDVAAKGPPHGQTGLHWAAHGGHVDTVRLLLEHQAPVDIEDASFGGTPMGWALHGREEAPAGQRERYREAVELLVAAGAPPPTLRTAQT